MSQEQIADSPKTIRNTNRDSQTGRFGGLPPKLFVCPFCGKSYLGQATRARKFCSIDCHAKSKRKYPEGKECCNLCGVRLNEQNWESNSKSHRWYYCKKCHGTFVRSYYYRHIEEESFRDSLRIRKKQINTWAKAHPREKATYTRERRQRIKADVFIHYSGSPPHCVRCGLNDIRVLSLDHIEGNGAEERRATKKRGNDFYLSLIKRAYPKGYQVLCHNCNWLKRLEEDEYGSRCRIARGELR